MRNVLVGVLALTLIMPAAVAVAETVVDEARGFTLALPDGFVAAPELVGTLPDILHVFVKGDLTDAEPDMVLAIEQLPGVLGRERLRPEDMPPGFQGRLFLVKWGAFEVEAFELPEQIGDVRMINYNVQIPLKAAAIQVKLAGPADRQAELQQLLPVVLNGLQGESNWIVSALPEPRIAESDNYGTILLTVGGVLLLIGIAALWFVSKNSAKGTVLLLAVGIYAASFVSNQFRVRELLMLTGVLRMLGFAGIILGIYDYFRKREDEGADADED